MICTGCQLEIKGVAQYVEQGGSFYHSECFKCKTCGAVLSAYCVHEGSPYCKPCYVAIVRPDLDAETASRCVFCSEPITNAQASALFKGKAFHELCLKCCKCERYILVGEPVTWPQNSKLPRCTDCTENQFCNSCEKYINSKTPAVTLGDDQYHASCLNCKFCGAGLADKTVYNLDGQFACQGCLTEQTTKAVGKLSVDGAGEEDEKRCAKCEAAIGAAAHLNALDRVWHADCFVCRTCAKPIDGSFYPTPDQFPRCPACHDQANLRTCVICKQDARPTAAAADPKKRMLKDSKDQYYHVGCLSCATCGADYDTFKILALKAGKNYCREHL